MKLLLTFLLLPMCALAVGKREALIKRPADARSFVVRQIPNLSEPTYANLIKYAFDPIRGGVKTASLQRAVRAVQWQVYTRVRSLAALNAERQAMIDAAGLFGEDY